VRNWIFIFLPALIGSTAAQKPKTTTPVKPQYNTETTDEGIIKNTPGSISSIVSIPYKGDITPPLPAQAKDHLLWYKGKKINDSILITPDAKLVSMATTLPVFLQWCVLLFLLSVNTATIRSRRRQKLCNHCGETIYIARRV
jgi:hypothetical protein